MPVFEFRSGMIVRIGVCPETDDRTLDTIERPISV